MEYVWPLSGTSTPDEMNTSFGPRIDTQRWDFHDGIDLPAPVGTTVYAVCAGTITRAGSADPPLYRSRHVRLSTTDADGKALHFLYLHLDAIAPGVVDGATVTQGQPLGTVGDDDATYPHLHFEVRKGGVAQERSVHPLHYLPHPPTPGFNAPTADRFNRTDVDVGARLLFDGASRLHGSLQSVSVDLLDDSGTHIGTRRVDFDDENTVNKGRGNDKGDAHLYVNGIGIEGYQRSPMANDGRMDLKHGILLPHLPPNCTTLLARVKDVHGNSAESGPIVVPQREHTRIAVDFGNGQMPPSPTWVTVCTPPGAALITNEVGIGLNGSRGMRAMVPAGLTVSATAAIERALPPARFEWLAGGSFNVTALNVTAGGELHVLAYLGATDVCAAATLTNTTGGMIPGLMARDASGAIRRTWCTDTVPLGSYVRWRLRLRRVGTRESTVILSIEGDEWARLNWDSTVDEPQRLRIGIGYASAGVSATVLADRLRLTELD